MSSATVNGNSLNLQHLTLSGKPVLATKLLTSGTFANSTVVVDNAGQISAVTAGDGATTNSGVTYFYNSFPLNPDAMLYTYQQYFSLAPSVAGTDACFTFTFTGTALVHDFSGIQFNTSCSCCFNHSNVAYPLSFFDESNVITPAVDKVENSIFQTNLTPQNPQSLGLWIDFQVGDNNENQYVAEIFCNLDQDNNRLIFTYNGGVASPNVNLMTQLTNLRVVQTMNTMTQGNAFLS